MSSSSQQPDNGQSKNSNKKNDSIESPPLVYLTDKWIQELTQRIRARPIPWEGYHRADLLSAEELKLIKSVDAIVIGQNRSKLDPLLDEHGPDYVSLYLRLLSKLSRTDTLQQILVLIDDMLLDRDDRLQLFLSLDGQEEQDGVGFPWKPFVKLLDVPDDFVQMKSAQFLTLLLVFSASHSDQPNPPNSVLPKLLTFLSSSLKAASVKPNNGGNGGGGDNTRNQSSGNNNNSSNNASSSPASRRSSPDFAEGNGPEIALVLLEALLRTQKYRQEAWEYDVGRMGQTPLSSGKAKAVSDSDQDQEESEDIDRGFLSELAHILRLSNVPASSSFNSPAGSGSATPSRSGIASSAASTLVAGATNTTNRAGTQIIYQTVLCFWLLSFHPEIAAELNVKLGLILLLADVARTAVKEKVTRVTVATLRNILAKAPEANAPVMLGAKCLTLSENLLSRKWSDEEIEEDLNYIRDELTERLKTMTTWDEYLSELQSGQLSFESPVHELDEFWKENAPKFVQEDGKVLKQLVTVLKESEDATTLAVGCSDLGKFVHFFEQGKKRVSDLGAKGRVMELMSHPDANVKYYAVHTVGKLVSASWR